MKRARAPDVVSVPDQHVCKTSRIESSPTSPQGVGALPNSSSFAAPTTRVSTRATAEHDATADVDQDLDDAPDAALAASVTVGATDALIRSAHRRQKVIDVLEWVSENRTMWSEMKTKCATKPTAAWAQFLASCGANVANVSHEEIYTRAQVGGTLCRKLDTWVVIENPAIQMIAVIEGDAVNATTCLDTTHVLTWVPAQASIKTTVVDS